MLKQSISALSQFVPTLFTLALAGASYWLALRAEIDFFSADVGLEEGAPDYYFKNFRTEEIRLARGQAFILHGPEAVHYPTSDTLIIREPTIVQWQLPNDKTTLYADKAHYWIEKEQLELFDHVEIHRSGSGLDTTITTDQLFIDGPNSVLRGTTRTVVTQSGRFYQTDAFEYRYPDGHLKAEGNVSLKLETTTP